MKWRHTHCRQCGQSYTFAVEEVRSCISVGDDMIEYPSCFQHDEQEKMDRKGKTIGGPYWCPVERTVN